MLLASLCAILFAVERYRRSIENVGFHLVAENGRTILTDADLIAYDWPSHTMIVRRDVAVRIIEANKSGVYDGNSFRVEARGDFCYEGVIQSKLLSNFPKTVFICLDCLDVPNDQEEVKLEIYHGFHDLDPRDNPRVWSALLRAGKLRE